MPDEPVKKETSPEPTKTEPEPAMGWRPRVHGDLQFNPNPFENFNVSGASVVDTTSVNETVTIRDAAKDTAPLQGSKDVSDEDYLGGET